MPFQFDTICGKISTLYSDSSVLKAFWELALSDMVVFYGPYIIIFPASEYPCNAHVTLLIGMWQLICKVSIVIWAAPDVTSWE